MATIPTVRFGGFEQVQANVEQENIQREQLAQQAQQFQQAQAQEAFALSVRTNLQRMEQQRLRDADESRAQSLGLKQSVEFGIKYDPAIKAYRPLRPEDTEFIPWSEAQAEKKARRPRTEAQKLEFERQKSQIATTGRITEAVEKQRLLAPGRELESQKDIERRGKEFDRKRKLQEQEDIRDEERALGRKLRQDEIDRIRETADATLAQERRAELVELREELRRGDPKRVADLQTKMLGFKNATLARVSALATRRAASLAKFSDQLSKLGEAARTEEGGAGDAIRAARSRSAVGFNQAGDILRQELEGIHALQLEFESQGLLPEGMPRAVPTGPAQPALPGPEALEEQVQGVVAAAAPQGRTFEFEGITATVPAGRVEELVKERLAEGFQAIDAAKEAVRSAKDPGQARIAQGDLEFARNDLRTFLRRLVRGAGK